jgi:hypothetical protein
MLSSRRPKMLVMVMAGLLSNGCKQEPPNSAPEESGSTGERGSEFSSIGIERLIPLRFVQLKKNAGDPDLVTTDQVLTQITRMNDTFRVAGIQFYLKSLESYGATIMSDEGTVGQNLTCTTNANCSTNSCNPTGACSDNQASCTTNANCNVGMTCVRRCVGCVADADCQQGVCQMGTCQGANGRPEAWSVVQPELAQVFPVIPSNAWTGTTQAAPQEWLHRITLFYSNPAEIVVWMPAVLNGTNSHGYMPYENSSFFLHFSAITFAPTINNTFAHEMGHFLGLPHTFNGMVDRLGQPVLWVDPSELAPSTQMNLPWVVNPQGGVRTRNDFYDLMYHPGSFLNNHLFFHSPADIASYSESQVKEIDRTSNYSLPACNTSCCIGEAGQPSNTVKCEVRDTDNGTWGEVWRTPDAPIRGGNGFLFTGGRGVNVMSYIGGATGSTSISESQVRTIQGFLRFDVPLQPAYRNMGPPQSPLYCKTAGTCTSRRHLLGFDMNRRPAAKLDFDGDGKRELAVWQPPIRALSGGPTVGTFRVLKSTTAYAVPPTDVTFGQIGDIPVPGDYVGDSKTDLTMFRVDPSTGQVAWLTCDGLNCSSPQTTYWGTRGDVPLPAAGDYDGDGKDDFIEYRPSTGQFRVAKPGQILNAGITVGAPFKHPIVGRFDTDNKPDFAVYDPVTATFTVKLSTSGWTTAITHCMNSVLTANGNSTLLSGRSDGHVIQGLTKTVGGVKTDVLAVWDSYVGLLYVQWNPTTSYTGCALPGCYDGYTSSIPFGTSFDFDANGRGDLASLDFANDDSASIRFRSEAGAACSNNSNGLLVTSGVGVATPRSVVFATDIDGDTKDDVVIVEPDFREFRVLFGAAQFTTWNTYLLGDQEATIL